ncbi:MAG: DsbA family oxidoreductase [Myxococcota bacterium]
MRIPIRLTSDFICPWCFIGERHLDHARKLLPTGIDMELHWRPFELNPDMPPEGMDRRRYRTAKFGTWARSKTLDAHTEAAAAAVGLRFDYARMRRTPNTRAAHRLVHLAGHQDRATEVVHAVFDAYFQKGRDIGDLDVLVDLAERSGVDDARVVLSGEESIDAIVREEQAAIAQGVHGVPHFDIDGIHLQGAQPPSTLADAITRAAEARSDAPGSSVSAAEESPANSSASAPENSRPR